jgi:hypothetical protein
MQTTNGSYSPNYEAPELETKVIEALEALEALEAFHRGGNPRVNCSFNSCTASTKSRLNSASPFDSPTRFLIPSLFSPVLVVVVVVTAAPA